MIKKIVFGTAGAITLALVIEKVIHGTQAADTAGKLDYGITGGKITKVNYVAGIIPTSVTIAPNLSIKNTSSNPLTFKNIFLNVSIPNSKGGFTKIASISQPAETTLKSGLSTILSPSIDIPFASVLTEIPTFIDYIIARLKGGSPTQDILIDGNIDSMGLTVPLNKTIKL